MKFKFTARELGDACGLCERSAQRILKDEGIRPNLEEGKRVYLYKDFTPRIERLLIKHTLMPHHVENINSLVPVSSRAESTPRPYAQGLSENLLKDQHVQRCTTIVREAVAVPPGWKHKEWKEHVANKHGIALQTVYKLIARQAAGGIAAHRHTKKNKGTPKIWDQQALEFGIGLALKRQHRKMSEKAMYKAVQAEAKLRGWAIGGYRSFCTHLSQKLNPLLVALRDGGVRALDNALPPILRSYADLDPFQIIVGDQHKFDFWVQDDETGAIFRPEGYFFIDLRTRLIYGFWLGRRYNSHSIGLALRLGCHRFGAFKSVYTDNGRPELSKYITDIVNEIAAFGVSAGEAIDLPVDLSDQDREEVACVAALNHRKAIVKNAKAKMIEGFFHHFEADLRNIAKVPGCAKRLSASGEEQEVDELELKKLAEAGRLLKFSEFVRAVIQTADYYNERRPHRGILKEWLWKPRPSEVTPYECLMACQKDGWRADNIPEDILDLAFLPKATRTVDRGRLRFRTALTDLYEHTELAKLPDRQEVTIRFDPLDPSYLLVFANSEFVCRALPVEFSSMVDTGLAGRKIKEKARLKKACLAEYHRWTSLVPDLVQYSAIPCPASAAAIVRGKLEIEQICGTKLLCEPTDEQLAAEIRQKADFEAHSEEMPIIEVRRSQQGAFFEFEEDRYRHLLGLVKEGAALSDADLKFIDKFKSSLIQEDARAYWRIYEQTNGISEQIATQLKKVG